MVRIIRNWVSIVLTTFLLMMGCGHTGRPKTQNVGQAQLAALVQEMRAYRIGMVEVLQIPASDMFRVPVTPEQLEKWWNYKLTIRNLDTPRVDELAAALDAVAVQQGDPAPDVRWGAIFYSAAEQKRVAAIYLDRRGRLGSVNHVRVSFAGGLGELRRILSVPFE